MTARPRVWLRRLALVLLLAALATGCDRPGRDPRPAERPSVLLLTVDTLRPDALGWVAGANATPALDALAAEGFRFPAAVAPVPLTLPSHTSLMTALHPLRHGVRDNGQVVGRGFPTLAARLRAAGWATAAFVSGYPLAAAFGLDRGFGHYDDQLTAGGGAWLERPADETTDAALAWAAAAPAPWFLWVHYFDPHYPYQPPAGFGAPGGRGAYDGEVAFVDRQAGRLLAALRPRAGEGLLTLFTGDHGESLGEHGEATHGFFIYDSTVAVPLVLHWPGRIPAGESGAPARLIDVAPTLLALLRAAPLDEADGTSLLAILAGGEAAPPPAYLETVQPWTSYGWAPLRAIRTAEWKYISAPRPELYRLSADPGETRNLATEERRQAADLRRRLDTMRDRAGREPARQAEAADPEAAAGDPETAARLRALGYLGAGAAVGEPPPGLPDPKDRLEMRRLLTEGVELLEQGNHRQAAARFERALESEPDNRFALLRSGVALLQAGEIETALGRLQRAVELAPAIPEAQAALAEALTRAGRYPAAAAAWRATIALQPRVATHWSNLGAALGLAGRSGEAVAAYQRAHELEPGKTERLIRLAFAEHAAGETDAAAEHLAAAARRLGSARFPHPGALGILLADLGRDEEAEDWLARSRPGEGDYAEARYRLARLALAKGDPAAARRALAEAMAADPRLRARAEADPSLAAVLP